MSEASEGATEPPTRADRERTQQERSIQAIEAIFSGADLADETLRLSNEFTDRHEARIRGWFRRRGRAD